jgi:poly(beta-D-mannuronate) lyase
MRCLLLSLRLILLIGLWTVPALTVSAEPCPPPPAAVRDLDIPRYYGDAKGTLVDPAQQARHDTAQRPLTEFLNRVTADADKAWTRPNDAARARAARCALDWLSTWARGQAWLGRMANKQAEYQRKWDLAGAALAYVKLRSFATAGDRALIEPWLIAIADAALSYFDDRSHQRNNHWYWLGTGIAAVAWSTDSDRLWTIARGIMADAARDIAADGTLAMELARGPRASHYHAFSAMALVPLAELGAAHGQDWYALGEGAVHRLVKVTLAGVADATIFDQLASVPQERPVRAGGGWVTLYAARFPERVGHPLPAVPPRARWLGGDTAILARALAAGR